MNTNIDARIADAEAELKKAKAIAIVYRHIENSYHCNYCEVVRDDNGDIVRNEDGSVKYVELNANDATLYNYDFDSDIYNMALATMKKVMEQVVKM